MIKFTDCTFRNDEKKGFAFSTAEERAIMLSDVPKIHIEQLKGIDDSGLDWSAVDTVGAHIVRGVRMRLDPAKKLEPLAAKLLAVGMAKAQVR